MQENRVSAIWSRGGAVINGWLAIPSGFSAEVMASCGWDSVTVDLQHGMVDYSTAVPMLQSMAAYPVTPLCRVPQLEAGIIGKLLDAGSYGIICPMVNTRDQCERLVSWCRYAPDGERSFGPIRAGMRAGPAYLDRANDTILAIAMAETAQAVDNIDAILSVPGLDSVYVGPSDLALSLGRTPRMDTDDPVVMEAMETILASAKRHGVPAGLHCGGADYALEMIGKGFQFVSIANDNRLMALAATSAIEAIRTGLGD